MHSPESLRQLTRLQSLGNLREQRAQVALKRAMTQYENLTQRLSETEDALDALEHERRALFEQHSGLMTTGELFQLRRRESILETRRIELMLNHTEFANAREEALAAAAQARASAAYARRRRDKITHVVGLFRRNIQLQAQINEDHEIEEHRYEH